MGVEGCTKCIKYMLFVFNFIFWLAGGVILGVALWLRHEPTTSNLLIQQIGDKQVPATFYIGIYIIIAVGAVMMFVGFLGCYGAIQESQCLLGTFFACLVILFACEVAAGIWGFVNREQVSKEIKQFYDEAYEQARSPKKEEYEKARPVIKVFHESLQCCKLDIRNLGENLCPSGIMNVDCHEKIDALFQSKLHLVGIAAAVVAVIMIIEMIFSMVLCCGIRIYSVY
ncbi:CD81 antigen [Bufo gargarizans]|uniref:CD81 antigen n=1 Tax=Bufo bufo TaxID=8384 RepID=UPI001ABE68A4|nr:CD81 antigen [Bufo bufo]XP_044126660.1 CD81 antigen [Bufo gargarizans]